jgi:hypothetical protein
MRDQVIELLGRATEDGGIAAFQAHDAKPLPRGDEQKAVDLILPHRVTSGALADIDQFRIGRELERAGMDQRVMEDDVGVGDEPSGLSRQQIGVAGACAD